uniref:Uncharacterized protein n=1 Tax=Pseudictyota dubia TaxID=2749911 RepID=A0A7R9WK87_9STRA|mmetsp:Transcript_8408/g.15337  ORF Transcript_8408/g.15337 Transcript_8408/m.15337 type:complete len:352 (+) Transcript_8408:57-1112(+)|eukprot:CAMPEP_0197462936 /NCGR_PEP_ID=MMETSP1175-20131217/60437_1 /TAXON_ID=1003142 /ORGANISM="Triceratium dubium, Strain CCMP147" /LENGTH=351 /DNA_ID=CAMNT_0042998565 /DNA_START=40 /DNA_END=1095 /DNA_ORIENTATION=+
MGSSMSRRPVSEGDTAEPNGYICSDDTNADCDSSANADAVKRSFPQFGLLSDDLVVEVLLFVSHGPYEHGSDDPRGSMTQVLPLVCRRFREYCDNSKSLWMPSLERLIFSNPESWGDGVRSILSSVGAIPLAHSIVTQVYHCDGDNRDIVQDMLNPSQDIGKLLRSMTRDDFRRMLRIVCKITTQQAFRNIAVDKGLRGTCTDMKGNTKQIEDPLKRFCPEKLAYYSLIKEHMMVTMPVFYMPSTVRVNRLIHLHFFEPRYRQLIAEVTAGRSFAELSGGELNEPFPQFVYACNPPLIAGTVAFVVEVQRCRMYVNGRADVLLNPVKSVRLVKVKERRGSGGLCDVVFKRI